MSRMKVLFIDVHVPSDGIVRANQYNARSVLIQCFWKLARKKIKFSPQTQTHSTCAHVHSIFP